MSAAELDDLARACRILALEGHNDLTLGHLSLRDEANGGFWLKRSGIGLDEVRSAEDFVLLSLEGDRLAGNGGVHLEWPIHAAILRTRRDVRVVGHTHSPWATRLSASPAPLLAVANYGAAFAGRVGRFERTSGLIDTPEFGDELAKALGEAPAILIRNHGPVVCGASVAAAVVTAIWLERAAADTLLAAAAGMEIAVPPEDELQAKRAKILAPAAVDQFWRYLCRRLATAEAR